MPTLAQHIAGFIHDAPLATLPDETIETAERVVADTFAAILSGAGSEVAPPMLRYLDNAGAPGGDKPIFGTARTTGAEMAALINATFGAAIEYDDVLSLMPGHPSAVIVAALCAAGPDGGVDGRRFLEAYVMGVEVGAKIAVGIGLGHYKRGYHGTGTLCIFSAVAALARLRGLRPDDTATALAIAASMSSGLQANFGTMAKPLHSGLASRSAVAACAMAEAGFTASHGALDGKHGFFAAYGTPESDPQRTIDTLGKPWTVLDPSIALKKFSCCYATHRGIDGLQRIKAQLGLTPETLERIVCRVPPGGLTPLPYDRPVTGLESKFSMPYALAAGIVDESYTIWTFTDAATTRPEIAAVLDRIDVHEDMACTAGQPDYQDRSYGSRGTVMVEATTKDGRSAAAEVKIAPGHPARALTWDDLAAKFADCAAYAKVAAPAAETAFAMLQGLRTQPTMNAITALLRHDTAP